MSSLPPGAAPAADAPEPSFDDLEEDNARLREELAETRGETPSLLALIPIIGILIYYLGFRDDIWEDMGGKAAEL